MNAYLVHAKYGYKIQLYCGLGMMQSTPMWPCLCSCSIVELCGDSVFYSEVWGGAGVYERCKTLWCLWEHCTCKFLTVRNLPVLKQCVVELCGVLDLVYCHFLYISRMCI